MLDGLAVIDKEAGWTSHDVVAACRKRFAQSKMGHAGTLDPDATGVLLVGLGKATRLLRYIGAGSKCYEGHLALGRSTTTLDASGETVDTTDMSSVSPEMVASAATALTGEIEQIPPMVSARKVGGVRLHRLARQGLTVERPSSRVSVARFEVSASGTTARGEPRYSFSVECSGGTYVRVLVDDLGRRLGGAGYLVDLRRTAVGPFGVGQARRVGDITPADLVPLAVSLSSMESCPVSDEIAGQISTGRALPRGLLGTRSEGPWLLVSGDGDPLAVYEADGDNARPSVVLKARG